MSDMTDDAVADGERDYFHGISPLTPFDAAEGWYTTTLDRLVPEWGEGDSPQAAMFDLLASIVALHRELHDEPDATLAPYLRYRRDFLCGLATAFGPHCGRPLTEDRA